MTEQSIREIYNFWADANSGYIFRQPTYDYLTQEQKDFWMNFVKFVVEKNENERILNEKKNKL